MQVNLKKNSSTVIGQLLFWFWPFAGFLMGALRGFRKRSDFIILFLFSGFISLNLAIDGTGLDIVNYLRKYIDYGTQPISNFWTNVGNFFILESSNSDIALYAVSFLLSRISSSPEVFFIVLGLAFGFFYAKNIREVGKIYTKKGVVSGLLFATILLFIFPTQGINQRFWIAGLMLVYGLQQNIIHTKKSGLVYMLLSPLVHAGMLPLLAVFFLYKITHWMSTKILLALIPVALYFSANLNDVFGLLLPQLTGIYDKKLDIYSGDFGEELQGLLNERNWYAVYSQSGSLIGISLMLLYISFRLNITDQPFKNLVKLNIYFLSFVAFISQFPMSFRYFDLVSYIQLITLFIFVQKYELSSTFKTLFFLASPFVALVVAIKLSAIFGLIKPTIFVSNWVTGWYIGDMNSIWHYIDFI